MRWPKKTPEGRAERLALAEAWLGKGILARARGGHRRSGLGDDDIADAIAALWTAHRIEAGTAETLPETPPCDETGIPMEIAF